MKRMKHWAALAAAALMLTLTTGHLMAQDDGGGPGGPPGGGFGGGPGGPDGGGFGGGTGGPGGRGNFDPAQFRQMMMDNIRDRLEVTNDAEWQVIQPLVQKVLDSRQGGPGGGPGGMGMMMGRRNNNQNGDNGGPGGPNGGNGQGNRRGGRGNQQPNPEADALQTAIDNNASNDDLKAAVTKLVESRKQKQAALEKAQSDLRGLLSVRQEAIAYSMGLL
jgi:hypothetical protein